jgi:hypothetical protein
MEKPFECTVHGLNDARQTEIHTAQPLVPQPSAFEFEVAIEKLIGHKFPGTDRIPAEIIQAGSKSIRSEIHKFINSIWNKEELSEKWNESIIVPIYKKGDNIDCSNYIYTIYNHFCKLHTKSYSTSCCHG